MARLPAALRRRVVALRATGVLGVVLVAAGVGGAMTASLRPDLVPGGHGVPAEAIGGAGLALGTGVALVGALHLVASVVARASRGASAATAVSAATLAIALLMSAVAALISATYVLIPALLLGVAIYGWIAAILAVSSDAQEPIHRS